MQCCLALSIWCCIFLILRENRAASLGVQPTRAVASGGPVVHDPHFMFGFPVAAYVHIVLKKEPPCDFRPPWLGNPGDGPATNGSRIHVDLPAIWLKVMYIQFFERLSYDIHRRCRRRQWWNTKEVQQGKFVIFMQNARNCWFRLQVCVSTENLETVKKHFGDNLDAARFSVQLPVLNDEVSGVSEKMKDVVSSTLAFTSNCNIFSEVRKLLRLVYVLPVATASAKRSFSFLHHLKTLPPNDH